VGTGISSIIFPSPIIFAIIFPATAASISFAFSASTTDAYAK